VVTEQITEKGNGVKFVEAVSISGILGGGGAQLFRGPDDGENQGVAHGDVYSFSLWICLGGWKEGYIGEEES